jgi:excisionase family DNA binding protein
MREKGVGAGSDLAIMTVHEVAEYLRLSEAKVYKMANEGRVPALRMGKTWRFKKELIDEWIRKETELALHVSQEKMRIWYNEISVSIERTVYFG